MRLMELRDELEKFNKNVFTINDVAKITLKDKDYLKKYLYNNIKKRNMQRLKRGIYAFKDIQKYEISLLYEDCYISLNSALEFYNLTTQIYRGIQLISFKQQKADYVFNISKKRYFGYKRVKFNNSSILIADHEKLLIDLVYFSGKIYLSEIGGAIRQLKEVIDIDKLLKYLKRFDCIVVNKRLGYLLDRQGIDIREMIEVNEKYDKLNMNLTKTGAKDKKWHLIINEEL